MVGADQLSDSPVAALRVLLQTAQDRLAPLLAVHMPAVQIDALDVGRDIGQRLLAGLLEIGGIELVVLEQRQADNLQRL